MVQGQAIVGVFLGIILVMSELMIYQRYKDAYKNEVIEEPPISSLVPFSQDLQIKLELLVREFKKEIPAAAFKKIINIKENLRLLSAQLDNRELSDYDLHIVKQTIIDYLPTTLESYQEVASDSVKKGKLENGKSSQEVLMEQLEILDEQIKKVVMNVNSSNADSLIVQGNFLKSKFSNDNDLL
ncbi:MAG: hypothetical protein GQ569_13425 [Methylococcaceae bacterium]|nr:hypothetical protein [Methylococcaceae bacterium]